MFCPFWGNRVQHGGIHGSRVHLCNILHITHWFFVAGDYNQSISVDEFLYISQTAALICDLHNGLVRFFLILFCDIAMVTAANIPKVSYLSKKFPTDTVSQATVTFFKVAIQSQLYQVSCHVTNLTSHQRRLL